MSNRRDFLKNLFAIPFVAWGSKTINPSDEGDKSLFQTSDTDDNTEIDLPKVYHANDRHHPYYYGASSSITYRPFSSGIAISWKDPK